MENQYKTIHYEFAIPAGEKYHFDIKIYKQFSPIQHLENPPEWTKLDFHQCKNCTYNADNYCPVALSLLAPSTTIGQMRSHQPAMVTVKTLERTYSKATDIQEGLGSMIGLLMATSGCPNTSFFRPAAWFHLPFSTYEETLYRISSTWLLQHYFKHNNIYNLQEIMQELQPAYTQIQTVNKGIFDRLKAASITSMDAPFNAVTILNSFAQMVTFSIDETMEEIRDIFP